MQDRNLFANKVAVVTGAASGIGRATAILLALQGARVVVLDIDRSQAEQVAGEIAGEGGEAIVVLANVSVEEDVQKAVAQTVSQWGGVHLLVNNAASFVQKGMDATVEEWTKPWKTNLLGAALFTRYVYPLMRAYGGGAIVNVASTSGLAGEANYATYNTSKAALLLFTQCAAVDLGGYKIRVNAVSPGVTITPALRAAVKGSGESFQEFERSWPQRQCLERLCMPEDVAHSISFLLSENAGCITGTNLVVDAGLMAKK